VPAFPGARAGAASFWAPYLDALPGAYPDPLWWPPPQRAALAATPLAAAVDDQASALEELRTRHAPPFPMPPPLRAHVR
jgi:hypothetical protein